AVGLARAFDVDVNLPCHRTSDAARRTRTDRHAVAEADAVVVLAFLHQPDDLDPRAFVRFDLGHQLLRAVHAQVHSFADLEGAGFLERAAAGGEYVPFAASGNGDADRILRDRLGFLGRRGGGHGGGGDQRDG